MIIRVERKLKNNNCTIGDLFVDGKFLCNTLEDLDRGLFETTPLYQIEKIKIKHKTAIPYGIYDLTLNIKSPRFGNKEFYQKYANGGRLPRILNVPGFEGVLIHVGEGPNGAELTSGCILIGKYGKYKDGLHNSKETFILLYKKLKEAAARGEKIIIEIV